MTIASFLNGKLLNEWIYFVMVLQLVGLMRYGRYPVSTNAFNVMQGFAVTEFLYVPNYLELIFPVTYSETSYEVVEFVNKNHNFLINIGSELLIMLCIQAASMFVYAILYYKKIVTSETLKKYQEVLITLFFPRTFMACVLSLIGCALNF